MAGLSANIITNKRPPPWPRPILDSYYYGVTIAQDGTQKTFPGFDNDSLDGSSIYMAINQTAYDPIKYYNGQGTQITTGVWASGYTPAEAWSDADRWVAHYMDKTDNKLYSLVIDNGTSPNTYRMVSVDKDGVVVLETAAHQVTNTAFDDDQANWNSSVVLYRVGGVDGTGNFRGYKFNANTDNNNGTAPYDGAYLEINTTGSTVKSVAANTIAEYTADGFLPNNFNLHGGVNSMTGPTANNIFGGPSMFYNNTIYNKDPIGWLLNMTTGKATAMVPFGYGTCPLIPGSLYPSILTWSWLGKYQVFPSGSSNITAPMAYEKDVWHNFIDETAVYYGIL